jgi:hypothetical protein
MLEDAPFAQKILFIKSEYKIKSVIGETNYKLE